MGRLYAAAGWVDLRPPVGGWMTGYGARVQPSAGIHDPITARALLLDDHRTRLAIVACDLLGFSAADAAQMRQAIVAHDELRDAHALIACTHTHSGPASMPMRGGMGHVDAAWLASAQARVVDLAARLADELRPASLAACVQTQAGGLGYNRQDPARPIDDTLATMRIVADDGSPLATLLNYAVHPVVLGPGNLLYSADYPGAAVAEVAAQGGGVGLFLLGAAGDVDPVVNRDRGWGTGTFDDVSRYGQALLARGDGEASNLTRDVTLRAATRAVALPLDPPPSAEELARLVSAWQADLERAQATGERVKANVATAMLQWSAEMEPALRAGAVPATLTAEVFAAALGDVRIVAVPFEPYSDIGLRVRERLRPHKVLFVGYANGLYGYCASRWAKEQGGYGPDHACRWFGGQLTALGLGADESLVEACVALAESL